MVKSSISFDEKVTEELKMIRAKMKLIPEDKHVKKLKKLKEKDIKEEIKDEISMINGLITKLENQDNIKGGVIKETSSQTQKVRLNEVISKTKIRFTFYLFIAVTTVIMSRSQVSSNKDVLKLWRKSISMIMRQILLMLDKLNIYNKENIIEDVLDIMYLTYYEKYKGYKIYVDEYKYPIFAAMGTYVFFRSSEILIDKIYVQVNKRVDPSMKKQSLSMKKQSLSMKKQSPSIKKQSPSIKKQNKTRKRIIEK